MEFYIKVTSIDKHQNVQYYGILARFKDSSQELKQDREFQKESRNLPDMKFMRCVKHLGFLRGLIGYKVFTATAQVVPVSRSFL